MKEIICNSITGFSCESTYVCIYDHRKKPFYIKKNKAKKFFFNLPKGVYYTSNEIKKLDSPIKYYVGSTPKVPFKEMPERFFLTVQYNPNKCSINLRTGEITLDSEIAQYPKFIIDFIICHEIAHFYVPVKKSGTKIPNYDPIGERNCDRLANKWMLQRGYNPSQIHLASGLTLSDCYRKKEITNYNKKVRHGR